MLNISNSLNLGIKNPIKRKYLNKFNKLLKEKGFFLAS